MKDLEKESVENLQYILQNKKLSKSEKEYIKKLINKKFDANTETIKKFRHSRHYKYALAKLKQDGEAESVILGDGVKVYGHSWNELLLITWMDIQIEARKKGFKI